MRPALPACLGLRLLGSAGGCCAPPGGRCWQVLCARPPQTASRTPACPPLCSLHSLPGVVVSDTVRTNLPCPSPGYWLAAASMVPATLLVLLGVRRYLVHKHSARSAGLRLAPVEGEVAWNARTTLVYPAICTVAGVVAGLFGVGGGIIKVRRAVQLAWEGGSWPAGGLLDRWMAAQRARRFCPRLKPELLLGCSACSAQSALRLHACCFTRLLAGAPHARNGRPPASGSRHVRDHDSVSGRCCGT